MSPEKFIKYSVPFFVVAIISRSIEEISFFYYAVPVMSLFYIVYNFWTVNGIKDKTKIEDTNSGQQQPSRFGYQLSQATLKVRALTSYLSIWRRRESGKPAVVDSEQVGMTDNSASGTLTSKVTPLLFLLPGIWFLLTSLWSSYPEVSASRALYFILISTGCISAGVLWIRYSGKNIFELLLPANVIVVLLCLFSLLTNIPPDSWTAGHGKGFIGFFGHQNLLASVLLFTLPVMFVKIKDKSPKMKVRKVFFFILLSLNLLVLALTYSRSAILALIFGVIVFLILNRNWKILSYSFVAAAVITSIIYLTPAVNNFADKILKKDFPEIYSSRIWMWEPSYKAALEGGLFGLGYGISHPEIRSGEYSDRFENGRLIREKGNSTLALIEESGLVGALLFILPMIYLLFRYRDARCKMLDKNNVSGIRKPVSPSSLHYDEASSIEHPASSTLLPTNYSLLTAALAAFFLHAQFEAWWVGVGSVQLPLFFVYLGLLFNNKVRQP